MLKGATAEKLYAQVKDLPVIDYHCHLDPSMIRANSTFSLVRELWLAADHYKWRAMRLGGVDETFITGAASYREKFCKYAEIMPALLGNPLYYWTHMELRQIFGICEPLNAESAARIYDRANEMLPSLSVRVLLRRFGVRYVATTDDPCDDLAAHGTYGDTTVAPTFRPDKAYHPSTYTAALEKAAGERITTAAAYLRALVKRLDHFVRKGCRLTDHGLEKFPDAYATDEEAEQIFARYDKATAADKDKFLGWLLINLAKAYGERGLIMQIHFAVIRNNNTRMFAQCGADSGFDLIGAAQPVAPVVRFLDSLADGVRPPVVLYTLNDGNLAALAAVTGAFRNVRMGAAWWFNDTVSGIRRNLAAIAEYSVMGTHLGMLTDSRSFSSYCRFDFFRRILCDFIGEKVDAGEYDEQAAAALAKDICYNNVQRLLRL